MSRALDTAKIMSVTLGLTPLRTAELLPWDIGTFSGRRISEALPEMIPFQTTQRDTPPPGSSESFNSYIARARRVVTKYLQVARRTQENIVLVSHARLIYVLEEILFGHDIPFKGPPAPGGIVKLSGPQGKVAMSVVYAGRDPRHVGVVEGLQTS